MNYFYPASSSINEGDFSWRDVTNEYVPLLLNWISKFGRDNVSEKLKEINKCIKLLHINWDDLNENIKKILRFGKFKNIDNIFRHHKKKKRISKDIVHYTFLRLKINSFKYKKYIYEFQKN